MTKYKSAGNGVTMSDGGSVEGYASTFDRVPDSYGDVIAKGAFTRTLKEWDAKAADGLSIPLLYGHNTDDPAHNIGKVTEAREDDRGLWIHAEFDADNETAQYARKLAAEGRLYQFSFAYAVRDAGEVELADGEKAYELRDLDLFEVSLVQIPANQNAVITGIKADGAQVKSGRRNSRADAQELRSIRESARSIINAIDGLLADEDNDDDDPDGGPAPEVNAEEPAEQVNAEEPPAKDAAELASVKTYAEALAEAINILSTIGE